MQADHPSSVTLDVLCICGAPYERTEKIVSVRDFNSAICEFCGTGLGPVGIHRELMTAAAMEIIAAKL